MFIVLLKFSSNKGRAPELMAGHKAWIERGFDDGVFSLVGSLEPRSGGCILASGTTLEDLRTRVSEDPFVAEDVVSPEILEVTPARADERMKLLLA